MRHGWRPLQNYIEVHERVLRFNQRYMEESRFYIIDKPTDLYLSLVCTHIYLVTFSGSRIRVDISIDAEIDDSLPNRLNARTFDYTFNANTPRGMPLIRYCGPHPDDHLERGAPHHKHHHKHDFTNEKEKIEILTDEERPHVGEFFAEILKRF